MSSLVWLQNYLSEQCDGQWEHEHGIEISTTDNPGWSVTVDVIGTIYEDAFFEFKRIERSEFDWVVFGRDSTSVFGRGGPKNLVEIVLTLSIFLSK